MKKMQRFSLIGIALLSAIALAGCGSGSGGGGLTSPSNDSGDGGGSNTTANTDTNTAIPTVAVYDVTISGTTYGGNTTFPTDQTSYTPTQNFQLNGILVVRPTADASGVNFNNGVNARDVGLFVGNPIASPEAGAIWLATNTTVFRDVGVGSVSQGLASLDVANVTIDEQAGTIEVRVDGNFYGLPAARSSQLNIFNQRSGVIVNVFQILAGGMDLQFGNDGQTVNGVVDVVGSGFIEPSSSRVQANITGILRN